MDYFQGQCFPAYDDTAGPVNRRASPASISTETSRRRFHPYMMKQGSDRNQDRTSVNNDQHYHTGSAIKEMYRTHHPGFNGYTNAKGLAAQDTCQNADARVTLSKAYQDYLQMFGYPDYHQQLYSLRCLNDISGTGSTATNTASIYMYPQLHMNAGPVASDVTTGSCASLSPELDHPFYWRRRAAPADGMTRTRDKYRVVYTEKQRMGLEKEYDDNKFITAQRKAELSKELDLSERQIKIWFQNRRAKERRDMNRKETSGKTDSSAPSPPQSSSDDSVASGTSSVPQERFENDIAAMTSCRFNETDEVTSSPAKYKTGQCRYQTVPLENQDNYTDQRVSPSYYGKRSISSFLNYKDAQTSTSGFPISPSGWNGSPTNGFVPDLNVSPLTVNQDFGFGPRL